jgi:hypothetical protein
MRSITQKGLNITNYFCDQSIMFYFHKAANLNLAIEESHLVYSFLASVCNNYYCKVKNLGWWDQLPICSFLLRTIRLAMGVMFFCVHQICTGSKIIKVVVNCLRNLCIELPLVLQVVKSCARLAGRGKTLVLQKTMAIIERARRLNPKELAFVVELADQLFLLEDYKAALATYKYVRSIIFV